MSWQQTVIVCFTVWMLIKSKQYQELLRYRYSGCGNKMTKSVSTMSWQKHEAGFVSQKKRFTPNVGNTYRPVGRIGHCESDIFITRSCVCEVSFQ